MPGPKRARQAARGLDHLGQALREVGGGAVGPAAGDFGQHHAAAFAGGETRRVELRFPGIELNFEGQGYLTSFALPNFYFHLSMAYAILRHAGVPLGKRDYLGQLELI